MEKLAHRAQVIKSLLRAQRRLLGTGLEHGLKNARAHDGVKFDTGVMHDMGARPLQHFQQHIGQDHQHGQHHQRRMAAAIHHPLINLQHVGRRRQHQDGGKQAEPCGAHEIRSQGRECVTQFLVFGLFLLHVFSSTNMYSGISPASVSSLSKLNALLLRVSLVSSALSAKTKVSV